MSYNYNIIIKIHFNVLFSEIELKPIEYNL